MPRYELINTYAIIYDAMIKSFFINPVFDNPVLLNDPHKTSVKCEQISEFLFK